MDLKEAMKEKNTTKVETIRSIISAVTNFEKANPGKDLDYTKIFKGIVGQREKSIEAFKAANDESRVAQEMEELAIVNSYGEKYQPKLMGEAEVREALSLTIIQVGASKNDAGKVMGAFSKEYKGKADMGMVNKILKELLS